MLTLAQYALHVPPKKLQGIIQIITNNSVFLRILGFDKTGDAFAYSYNRQTTLGGIAFRGLNQQYTPDTGVVNPMTETLKIFGGTVDTDRQLAKGDAGKRKRAENMAAKTKKAGLFFDKYVIDGDSSVNPLEFDGLNRRLINRQVVTAGANGAQLTLPMVDTVLDRVVGAHKDKIITCSNSCRTKMKQLVQSSAGGAAVADFVNGELARYNGAAIETIDEDGDEQAILGWDETQGSDNFTGSLYVVRPGAMEGDMLRGLVRQAVGAQPIDVEDYGERNGVYQELVEAVLGITLNHPRCAARLKGIARPPTEA